MTVEGEELSRAAASTSYVATRAAVAALAALALAEGMLDVGEFGVEDRIRVGGYLYSMGESLNMYELARGE